MPPPRRRFFIWRRHEARDLRDALQAAKQFRHCCSKTSGNHLQRNDPDLALALLDVRYVSSVPYPSKQPCRSESIPSVVVADGCASQFEPTGHD